MTGRIRVLRFLRRWHGRAGVAALAFFLLLAATGILLNHGRDFGLDGREIRSPWLARWYGIPVSEPVAFAAGSHRLIAAGGTWLLDDRPVAEHAAAPVGFVEAGGVLYAASAESLNLYLPDGQAVDKISARQLPAAPVAALGRSGERVALRAGGGTYASSDGIAWQPIAERDAQWSAPAPIPVEQRRQLAARLVPGIAVDKLLQDLHSGRFFGAWGPLVMDAAALTLALIAVSGLWMFLRSHHR